MKRIYYNHFFESINRWYFAQSLAISDFGRFQVSDPPTETIEHRFDIRPVYYYVNTSLLSQLKPARFFAILVGLMVIILSVEILSRFQNRQLSCH